MLDETSLHASSLQLTGSNIFFSAGDCPPTCLHKILANIKKMGFDFHRMEGQFRSAHANLLNI